MIDTKPFRLGLIINPLAGIGGSVALKGSDGKETVTQALALGARPMAGVRTEQALQVLVDKPIEIITYPGEMGADVAIKLGFKTQIVGDITPGTVSYTHLTLPTTPYV